MITKAVQQFQLGTVMNNEKQVRETLGALKNAGYDGIELCGFMIRPSGLFVRLLTKAAGMPIGRGGNLDWVKLMQEFDLKVVGLHEDMGRLEKEPGDVIRCAHAFDTPYVTLTGMYGFDYGSLAAVQDLAERLNKVGKALSAEGLSLLYHNHNIELTRVETGETAYEVLIRELDPEAVNFEFDSYWMTDAGANVPKIMQTLGKRMKLWHINDRGPKKNGKAFTPIIQYDSRELGDGCMDLRALADIALANEVSAVILESHRNWIDNSPVKSFQRSAEFLKTL